MENKIYRVYNENFPKETLFTGDIWKCEKWITKNGVINTSYVIDRIDNKPVKSAKSKSTEIKALF